jgi:sterol desaturase/sphingolipid hydroxylase (fatty acid hydroxylase superfamily)
MELLAAIVNPEMLAKTLMWMLAFFVVFSLLAKLYPNISSQPYWRKDSVTDAVYWIVMPILYNKVSQLVVTVGLVIVFWGNDQVIQDVANAGYGPLRELPLWLQVFLVLFIQDIMMYWVHRMFHGTAMWKYHAIHHSSEQLDWLSALRFHPVNVIISSILTGAIVFLMGFSPTAFYVLAPFNMIFNCIVHANLNWTFGPFKYFLASPVFHRWHHTSQAEGRDKNFAPTFPFLDIVFGTFYMPKGKLPEIFGVPDENIPHDFIGQLTYPFRHK